ncbi:hypothetical protein CYMTET_34811 [Cymbomonas tetramitiformis]|uniref:J domain-containing protein n=1 Tax=Cymbomonas tetramitiformis TaxID=36881 RepID=A0AAE0FAI9_9CHLO|nr:hypothetical protein CYMTET_34811 [Cymbomonas tetramitiformis]
MPSHIRLFASNDAYRMYWCCLFLTLLAQANSECKTVEIVHAASKKCLAISQLGNWATVKPCDGDRSQQWRKTLINGQNFSLATTASDPLSRKFLCALPELTLCDMPERVARLRIHGWSDLFPDLKELHPASPVLGMASGKTCMSHGFFHGEAAADQRVEWKNCDDFAFDKWSVNCVDKVEETAHDSEHDKAARHLKRLLDTQGPEAMRKMTPRELLVLDRDSQTDQIKQRFRQLSMHFHPDKNPTAEAKELFVLLQEAYAVLKDPARRREAETEAESSRSLFTGSEFVVELEAPFFQPLEIPAGELWLVMLYAPWCKMSKALAPFMDHIGQSLRDVDVKVAGACRCGALREEVGAYGGDVALLS